MRRLFVLAAILCVGCSGDTSPATVRLKPGDKALIVRPGRESPLVIVTNFTRYGDGEVNPGDHVLIESDDEKSDVVLRSEDSGTNDQRMVKIVVLDGVGKGHTGTIRRHFLRPEK